MRQALAALLLLLPSAPRRGDEILVFAAASLTEALQEIGKAFTANTGTPVKFSFGASSDLARQIEAGAPADIFFSADTAKMNALESKSFVRREDRREFLSNALVVVVAASSSTRIADAKDLARLPRLAVADPEAVPAGIYAREWLESRGLWPEIRKKVVPALDVRAVLAAVASEAVPAGIVYRTDAAVSPRVRVAFIVPDGPEIRYSVAKLAHSPSRAARLFVEFLAGPVGRAVFRRQKFTVLL